MTHENKIYCAKLWSHLVLMPGNRYKPCCRFGASFLLEPSDTELIFSKELVNIREKMINDIRLDECSKCRFEEATRGDSLRIRYNDFALHETHFNKPEVKSVEIAFSNLCDLQCLGCNSEFSTRWAQAEKKLNLKPYPAEKIDQGILDKIDLKKIQRIKITGGEPLLSKEHNEFCKKVLADGSPENLSLSLFTNGNHRASSDTLELWKKTKHCQVFFSIDGLKSTNEYFRLGSSWDVFFENIKWHRDQLQDYKNIELTFISAVNIFNVGEFIELDDYLEKVAPSFFRAHQPITTPEFLCSLNLPDHVKKRIIERYESHISNFKFTKKVHKKNYQTIVATLKQPAIMEWQEVLEKIKNYDVARGTSSEELLKKILNQSL